MTQNFFIAQPLGLSGGIPRPSPRSPKPAHANAFTRSVTRCWWSSSDQCCCFMAANKPGGSRRFVGFLAISQNAFSKMWFLKATPWSKSWPVSIQNLFFETGETLSWNILFSLDHFGEWDIPIWWSEWFNLYNSKANTWTICCQYLYDTWSQMLVQQC